MSAPPDVVASAPDALIIVQARMGSTRLPGKSLADIEGRPAIWYTFRQLSFVRGARAILATSTASGDDVLADYARAEGWPVFRGSEADVLDRYHAAALAYGALPDTVIVRVTGDGMHPDPNLIEAALALHRAFGNYIAVVATAPADALPYGVYVQSCRFDALDRAHREATAVRDREHVFPYILENPKIFSRIDITPSPIIAGPAFPIDTPQDLERARKVQQQLSGTALPYTTASLLAAGLAIKSDTVKKLLS
jgi:spore coat polysaccharide biosynthesis protein SpsF